VKLPWLVQAGLCLMAFGGAGDVAYHSVGGLSHTLGHALHVLTLVGMVATLAGIVLEGVN
jgi:hypothetical protein